MPYYKVKIRVHSIDKEYGFPAENMEEAKVRMQEYFDSAVSENTGVCTVEQK
jgi:hypothetical protein